MPYKIKINDTEYNINSSYPNIAFSSKVASDAIFNPWTEYSDSDTDTSNTYINIATNNGSYISIDNKLLSNKWGKQPVISEEFYLCKGSALLFADKRYCPTPKRDIKSNTSNQMGTTSAYDADWGDIRIAGGEVLYLKYNNGKLQYKKSSHASYTNTDSLSSLIFIDAVAGGGGGGGAHKRFVLDSTFGRGGGGGGGGASCHCVLDLKLTGEVIITTGMGGAGGTNGSPTVTGSSGAPGGNTTISFSSGTRKLICKGGSGGNYATTTTSSSVAGGDGGKFTHEGFTTGLIPTDDSDNLSSLGVLYLLYFQGAKGGDGVPLLISSLGSSPNSNSEDVSYEKVIYSKVLNNNVSLHSKSIFGNSNLGVGLGVVEPKDDYYYRGFGGGGGSTSIGGFYNPAQDSNNDKNNYYNEDYLDGNKGSLGITGTNNGVGGTGGTANSSENIENTNDFSNKDAGFISPTMGLNGCAIIHCLFHE